MAKLPPRYPRTACATAMLAHYTYVLQAQHASRQVHLLKPAW